MKVRAVFASRGKHIRISTHPGKILLEDFLHPLGITQVVLARHLGIPLQRVNEIIRGKRGVTVETAILLGCAFDVSAEFWMNLQTTHDLGVVMRDRRLKSVRRIRGAILVRKPAGA